MKNLIRIKSLASLIILMFLLACSSRVVAVPFEKSSWISLGKANGSYAFGFLGNRMDNIALEFGMIAGTGSRLAYGIDCYLFKDLSEKTSLFGSVGFYRLYDYHYTKIDAYGETDHYKASSRIAMGIGLQFDLNEKYDLGLGFHSVRGLVLQVSLGF